MKAYIKVKHLPDAPAPSKPPKWHPKTMVLPGPEEMAQKRGHVHGQRIMPWEAKIIRDKRDEGVSYAKIGELINRDGSTVHKWYTKYCRDHGIPNNRKKKGEKKNVAAKADLGELPRA